MSPSSDLEPSAEWRAKHIALDESWHPKTKLLSETAEAFARHSIRNSPRRSRWLVLAGGTGCGKTHAAKRILARFRACRIWAWEQGYWGGAIPHATFWRWHKLADLDEEEWQGAFQDITGGNQVNGSNLLIIDDLGTETDRFKSGVPLARLQLVLDAMEHRWLLVTTNVQKQDWAKKWDGRIASRLNSAAYLSLFQVPDYRPNLAKQTTQTTHG